MIDERAQYHALCPCTCLWRQGPHQVTKRSMTCAGSHGMAHAGTYHTGAATYGQKIPTEEFGVVSVLHR